MAALFATLDACGLAGRSGCQYPLVIVSDLSPGVSVYLFQRRCLEQQCRAQGHGGNYAEDRDHASIRLIKRLTYLREPVERKDPLDCTKDKNSLHQSCDPGLPNKQQRDQEQRTDNRELAAIAHEMRAENDQAENNRDIEENLLQSAALSGEKFLIQAGTVLTCPERIQGAQVYC